MPKQTARKKRAQQKSNNTIWIVGAVAAAVVLVLAIVLINLNAGARAPVAPSAVSAGRVLGKADAPVTIEMLSDFQ